VLNRAVAVAEIHGPQAALNLIDGCPSTAITFTTRSAPTSSGALGTPTKAAAYRAAIDRTNNAAEIAFLKARVDAITRG
jgi:RNA polymerase sigma-70 factor (ECF subfamily)